MTISKQKLVLALALGLLSAVSAQAITGQQENQETTNTETVLSERNARLEQQYAQALAAGLRPTLTLVDFDAECGSSCCGHNEFLDGMRETIEEKNKTIDELQAKILVLEAKNQPWNLGDKATTLAFKTWKNRKLIAALAAVAGSYVATQYVADVVEHQGVRGLMPDQIPTLISETYWRIARWCTPLY